MDQRLAVEAEIARLRAFLPKAVEIAEIAVGPVENLEAISAGGEDAVGDDGNHRGAARQHSYPGLPRNIVRPEHEPGQPHLGSLRGGRELLGTQHRLRGFDHRPDPDRWGCVDIAQAMGDFFEILYAGNLWNQNAVGPGLPGHHDVIHPPRRIQRVDPDQDLALAVAAGRDGLRNLVARQRLGVRGDGILEIEDEAVGGQIARLFQRPHVRSGHEQQTSARTDHGVLPFGFQPSAISSRPAIRKTCSGLPLMVSKPHANISTTSDRGLSRLHIAAASDRTITVP